MYLKTAVLTLNSSLFCNKSENIKGVNLLGIYSISDYSDQVRPCLFVLSTYLAQLLSFEVLRYITL